MRMIIDFKVIPHSEQRYDTIGDWAWCEDPSTCPFQGNYGDGTLHIRVSDLGDPRYSLLVFYHELGEALMCRQEGVTQEQVDKFDMEYEKARENANLEAAPCGCPFQDEPGDDIHAPYHPYHVAATDAERAMARVLQVSWEDYADAVEKLG